MNALAGHSAATHVELTGILDPQNRAGRSAVTAGPAGSGGDFALSPAPAIGFSGAAALDGDKRFAGIALLKPAAVAGPATATAQAVLVQPETVRGFHKANGVDASRGSPDAKAATLRVICVRK